MTQYVLSAGQKTPDKIALEVIATTGSDAWSYARLSKAILTTAQVFLDAGIVAGDKIILRLGNTVDFPISYLAAIAVGIIPIPTSPQLTTREVDAIIAQMSPRAMVWDGQTAGPSTNILITLMANDLQTSNDAVQAIPVMGDPNRLAYIVYTSGTGGIARAVGHAHRAVWARRMMWADWYDLNVDDRLLHAGAFNWTYTMGTGMMDPWAIGATALIPAPDTPLAAIPALLTAHKATIFAAAPGVYRRILRSAEDWFTPTLRHGLSAGEKMPRSVRDLWTATTSTPACEAYGMSECSTFVSSTPANPDVFKPQSGRKVAILDTNNMPVTLGQSGVIAINADDQGFMLGYQGQDTPISDGWFLTGDQGQMDENGHITYLGRADDMMNAGGYRVSPLEVEAAMSTLTNIGECAAVAVQIKADVEVIALFFTGAADEQTMRAHAEDHLAHYKCPRLYIARDVLPKGANNKLLRKVLRAEFSETRHG